MWAWNSEDNAKTFQKLPRGAWSQGFQISRQHHSHNNSRDRGYWSPTFSPHLLGRSFEKARNFTALVTRMQDLASDFSKIVQRWYHRTLIAESAKVATHSRTQHPARPFHSISSITGFSYWKTVTTGSRNQTKGKDEQLFKCCIWQRSAMNTVQFSSRH